MMSTGDSCGCAVLETRSLSLSYGSTPAFTDVSLQLPKCEITALIGPSGCGKTSLLSTLNRLCDLVPHCRVSGQVLLEGRDIRGRDVDLVGLRRRVGMIFQRPNPFGFSIAKNLALPLREHGIRDRTEIERRTEGALRDVGLWDEVKDRLRAPATQLSGGQQQRLCLARTLALEPEVLLLDEPCSALDPISSATVEDHLLTLRGRFTMAVVTHNLAQAKRIADRVAFFWAGASGGRLIECGTADAVFESPQDPLTRDYVAGLRG
ncbi:MAG: phosphate ABC transporter ATP-binding protein [Planctomycetes bacterium]|nr:phosphate ABC transporter ATP-binding protein [Planctomycetota bacterium]